MIIYYYIPRRYLCYTDAIVQYLRLEVAGSDGCDRHQTVGIAVRLSRSHAGGAYTVFTGVTV